MKALKITALIALVMIGLTVFFIPFLRRQLIKKYAHPPIAPITSWSRFLNRDGDFSVFFPGNPASTSISSDLPGTNIEIHLFYVNANIQNGFAVGYSDSPLFARLAKLPDPQEYLKDSEFLTASNDAHGKIVYDQAMKLGDYPAREFEYVAGGKANYSVRMRYILAGQRFYEIHVVFLTTAPCVPEQQAFFSSFKIQNKTNRMDEVAK